MKHLIIFKAFLFINVINFSCTKEFGFDCISGSGAVEKRVVELQTITRLELAINGKLFVSEGPQFIEIEAPADIIDKILRESDIDGENWTIEMNDCYNGDDLKIWATLEDIKELKISGSGNIETLDTLTNVTSLNLEIDGSGDIQAQLTDAQKLDLEIQGSGSIQVDAEDVLVHSYDIQGSGDIRSTFNTGESSRMRIEGSGNIEATGILDSQIIDIDGQGDVLTHGLCTRTCDIQTRGSGNCEVKVTDRLNISIEGSGDVCYKGQPAITLDTAGSGKLLDCN